MTALAFDTPAGAAFLDELRNATPVPELEAILEVDDTHDLDLTQEQVALAGVVAEMVDARTHHQQAVSIARRLRAEPGTDILVAPAHACVNRLLMNPFAPLWRGHSDGGVSLKREVRAIRARLHRACSG